MKTRAVYSFKHDVARPSQTCSSLSRFGRVQTLRCMPQPTVKAHPGGIKRWCCLTSVCLTSVWRMSVSVAYIGPKSRTERPRKTKIGTEVAHVARDSDTIFKVRRSKVKATRPIFGWLYWQANMDCSLWPIHTRPRCISCLSPLAGLGGDILWRPAAYSLLAVERLEKFTSLADFFDNAWSATDLGICCAIANKRRELFGKHFRTEWPKTGTLEHPPQVCKNL